MNKFNLSSYSETDSYDSESDHHVHFNRRLIDNFFNTKNLPRYEFKIEISELLAKFAEHSRLGSMLSCKYINHPIMSGLILYIPYYRISKYRESSFVMDSESDWGTYESVNEEQYEFARSKSKLKKVFPTKAIYLQRGKSKNDVSYARMVKKPHVPNLFHYKEEMWGQRYPNKRYTMNILIQSHVYRILHIISDRCANEFLQNDFNITTTSEMCKKIQIDIQYIRQNLRGNLYESFQQVLNDFGKLFYSSRLICMNHPHLLTKISHLEIEFENQLEIHFGEWNTK